jgi:hypothetical protein
MLDALRKTGAPAGILTPERLARKVREVFD